MDTNTNSVSKPPQASRCTISNHTIADGFVKLDILFGQNILRINHCEKLRSLSYSLLVLVNALNHKVSYTSHYVIK